MLRKTVKSRRVKEALCRCELRLLPASGSQPNDHMFNFQRDRQQQGLALGCRYHKIASATGLESMI